MLAIDGDQVQIELCGPLSLWVLKDDLEVSCLLICLKSDLVIIVCQLHNLSKVVDRNSDNHVCVSSVVLKAINAKIE